MELSTSAFFFFSHQHLTSECMICHVEYEKRGREREKNALMCPCIKAQ